MDIENNLFPLLISQGNTGVEDLAKDKNIPKF